MTVKKIFWEDPYLTKLEAKVTSVTGDQITLDRTIFYAFSGGQASDSGTFNGKSVISAEKIGFEIIYTLTSEHGMRVGDEVAINIDLKKRYELMRLHFAAEIILELVYQNFNHPQKIGANINSEMARLDFKWIGNIADVFPALLDKANEIISADYHITSAFSDEENERRYWQIDGFAKVDCGGTHIKRTGEIGKIFLKRKNIGAGKERIEIYLAED